MNKYTRISGTGSCLPPRRLTNADLVTQLAGQGVESSDDWIVERTGIRARHFADAGVNSSDLALIASQRALQAAGVDVKDIDLIIVGHRHPIWFFRPRRVSCRASWVRTAEPHLMCRRFAVVSFTR
jgi:3-oxoacyl-[acyl-carrier-protein] synthase-3